MDLERSGMRGRIGRVRARKKRGLSILENGNLLCFLGTFSSFQPSLGRAMRTWAQISSFRPLIKHSLKKALDMPSILKAKCSNEVIKSSMY
jgi:hypothetical protein